MNRKYTQYTSDDDAPPAYESLYPAISSAPPSYPSSSRRSSSCCSSVDRPLSTYQDDLGVSLLNADQWDTLHIYKGVAHHTMLVMAGDKRTLLYQTRYRRPLLKTHKPDVEVNGTNGRTVGCGKIHGGLFTALHIEFFADHCCTDSLMTLTSHGMFNVQYSFQLPNSTDVFRWKSTCHNGGSRWGRNLKLINVTTGQVVAIFQTVLARKKVGRLLIRKETQPNVRDMIVLTWSALLEQIVRDSQTTTTAATAAVVVTII
jgi:hypothetical protein